MTEWQTKFTQKLETVRKTSSDYFEQIVEQTLMPTY
jgi:hypothetical protein